MKEDHCGSASLSKNMTKWVIFRGIDCINDKHAIDDTLREIVLRCTGKRFYKSLNHAQLVIRCGKCFFFELFSS